MNGDMPVQSPTPVMAPENRPFWDAANQDQLLLKGCCDCGRLHWYPRALCPWCLSANTQWCTSRGYGSIYSYTIMGDTVVVYVQLVEGVVMLGNLVGTNPGCLRIDAPVEVCFARSQSGQNIPMFRLLDDGETG